MERTHAEQQQVSSHYKPCLQDGRVEQGGFDDSVPTVDLMSVDQREAMRDMDDSQLIGAPEASVTAKEDVSVPEVEMLMMMKKKMEVKPVETMVAKRKRGRLPGRLAKTSKTTPLVRKKKDEEDVCFICFDGGSLVLCDRRGCPKAYHPACIKRDESFFKSRAKWNCGWHICSSCQKAAYYMCCTCTYSLCKGCIKDADYLSVRGNNGFCGMCMRTVMLIENFQENTEVAKVDFDDKSSWEYLFKMYWIFLKGKLSLTLDELIRAKNPWKGAYSIAYKVGSSGELYDGIDDKVSSGDNSCAGLQTNNPKKRKANEQTIFNKDSLTMEKTGSDKYLHQPGGTIWASKELLEFVAHMKNGTSKVAEPYKLGERNTDVMLEILNLETKEVSIDGISNQDFCEDECKCLRQSIKCGLIKRLTVGEIQEKAMTLQAVRVNDMLEAEIIRLNHLRDRASEKGHEKEFRECVEKLQLLNSPEERQRRLLEICEVHIDPKMDPSYDSEDDVGELDEKKQDDNVRTKLSGYARKESDPFSARRAGDVSNDSGTGAQKNLAKSCKQTRKAGITSSPDKGGATWFHEIMNESSWKKKEASDLNNWDTPANQINTSGSLTIVCNSQAVVKSKLFSGVAAEISPLALSTQADESANNFETDKIWHYRDPNGIIRGQFSMSQLRKWNTSGHFPPDLRIWRINEKQDKSVLLNDALSGKYHEAKMVPDNGNLLSQDLGVTTDDRDNNGDGGLSTSTNASQIDNKKEESWKPVQNDSSGNDGLFRSDERVSSSSSWTTPADVTNTNERKNGSFEPGWDSSKGNSSWPDQPQADSSSLVPPAFSGKSFGSVSYPVREVYGGECTSGRENGNCNSQSTADGQFKSEQGFEHRFDSEGHSSQSSGQSWRPPPVNVSSNDWVSSFGFIPQVKSLKTTEQTQEIDFQGQSSPTPKQSNEDLEVQAPENRRAASSVPVQHAGPNRSTASSLVGGGRKVSEVADELGGYSSTPSKPSIGDWGSSIVSVSSLKPTEIVHAATPTSINDQLTHSSPSHPTSNASSWQAIVTESTEFCSLVDESVSDLLAEVEAMESLDGLPSPTSIMKCRDALTQDSKHECISPLDEFSPGLDPGKSDALSSTGDLQAPSQSTVTDERDEICCTDVIDSEKISSMHSSSSVEVEGDAKPADISVNQWEARSEIQPPPSAASWDISTTEMSWRVGSESRTTSWRGVQGSANLGWGALDQRNTNMGWGSVQIATQDCISMNFGASAGNPGFPKSRIGGDRFSGPGDWGFQSRDVGYGRGRGLWNSQSFFVGGNESSFRPPKSHRICKFYGSGYCKKGASCDYLHP